MTHSPLQLSSQRLNRDKDIYAISILPVVPVLVLHLATPCHAAPCSSLRVRASGTSLATWVDHPLPANTVYLTDVLSIKY